MTNWTQAALTKAQGRGKSLPPRPPDPPAALDTPAEPTEVTSPPKLEKWLLHYQVAEHHYQDGYRRIVFTGVPMDQVAAFLLHCQQYKP